MHKTLTAVIAALSLAAVAAPAAAAINARQLNQMRNIDAGVRSGKLTPREAATLRAEQRMIERTKHVLKSRNGYGDGDERRIHRMQDAAARHIDRLKFNAARVAK